LWSSGVVVSIRPPPVVFSIVWPILYIMLGLSWFFSRKIKTLLTDIFYGSLVLLLSLWIIIYSCENNKLVAVYILILSIVFSLLSYTVGDLTSKLLIVPLIGWLLFATLLNVFEVQLSN
jgi:tryptophan-rich sensory protein